MTLTEIIDDAYLPAITLLGIKDDPEARVQMLAMGLQESRFKFRRQMNNGPAMGFWQFERGGGVKGVLNHPASRSKAYALCKARGVAPEPMAVWQALENDDVLAAGFARLLLWTDARALPAVDDVAGGWAMYLRNWRPGKPHPETWAEYHDQARAEVGV